MLPPHICTSKGRKKNKRMDRTTRKRAYLKRRKTTLGSKINEGEVIDDTYFQLATGGVSTKQWLCSVYGSSLQKAPSYNILTNGLGIPMSTQEQNTYLNQGYLVLDIGSGIDTTIVPNNHLDYEQMRNNSKFSTNSFKFDDHNNINFDSDSSYDSEEDDNEHSVRLPQQHMHLQQIQQLHRQ